MAGWDIAHGRESHPAVFLAATIKLSVSLLMDLIKYSKLLGLSLSVCP